MRFDHWPDDEPARLEVCPEGKWPAVILEAAEVLDPYTAERYAAENPTGQKLKLRLQVQAAGQTFEIATDFPSHWRVALVNLARAAGVPEPAKGAEWDEHRLEGKNVIVQTTNKVDGKGRTWTRVERWYPRETPMDAASRKDGPPPKLRATAARSRPKPADADDIPF